MFFLFVTFLKSELWMKVLPTCKGIVAVIKPPVTWEKFDLPGWQILSRDRAKIEHERRMPILDSYFYWGRKYTQVSFSAKNKVKAVFSMNQIMSLYIYIG